MDKVKRINTDTFIISKITEKLDSIKKEIEVVEDNKKQTEKAINDKKMELTEFEATLYGQDDSIKTLKENRAALKERLEALKKIAKL